MVWDLVGPNGEPLRKRLAWGFQPGAEYRGGLRAVQVESTKGQVVGDESEGGARVREGDAEGSEAPGAGG